MKHPSLSLYLVAAFILLLAIPIAFLGARQAARMQSEADFAADEELRFAAQSFSRGIVDYTSTYLRAVSALARQAEMEEAPLSAREPLQRLLSAFHAGHPETNVVMFLGLNGIALAAIPETTGNGRTAVGMDYSDRDYFQKVLRTGRPAIGKALISRVTGQPTVGVVAPVHDRNGKLVGMATASVPFAPLSDDLREVLRPLLGVALTAVDADNRVLLTSNGSTAQEQALMPDTGLYAPTDAPMLMRSAPDEAGVPTRAAIASLADSGLSWRLLIKRPLASIQRDAEQSRRGWRAAAIAVGVGGLLFALLSIFFIARPMGRLSQLALAIGEGDLTRSAPGIQIWFPNEMVQLLTAMSGMQVDLRDSVRMFASLQKSLDTAQFNIRNLVSEQGSSVLAQREQLEEVAAYAKELHGASLQAASDASVVTAVAARAEEARGTGQEALRLTFEQLGRIQEEFAEVAQVTRTLERQVGNIVAINSDIDAIAGRSNVLSTNASIEAMRAGESGKGFSNIARSIRELSDSSHRSRKQINETIGQVRDALRKAAEQSHNGRAQIEAGLQRLRSSGDLLQRLAGTVQESARAAQNVARSVERQRTAIARIDASTGALRDAITSLMERGARADAAATRMHAVSRTLATFLSKFRTS